jgi:hypothetical protein
MAVAWELREGSFAIIAMDNPWQAIPADDGWMEGCPLMM